MKRVVCKNFGLALRIVEKYFDRYPSHPSFYGLRVRFYFLLGEKDQAIAIYEQAQISSRILQLNVSCENSTLNDLSRGEFYANLRLLMIFSVIGIGFMNKPKTQISYFDPYALGMILCGVVGLFYSVAKLETFSETFTSWVNSYHF